jgi:AraC-like DNA-binding protein
MLARRPRHPALGGLVQMLWASEGGVPRPGARERVLPTGAFHLVFRLGDSPLRLLRAEDDAVGYPMGHAVIGGARAEAYLRDVSTPVPAVGVQLAAGAAGLLLGPPPGELSERHTSLQDIWGREAERVRERLAGLRSLEARLDLVERLLAVRLRPERGPHPAVVRALQRLAAGATDVGPLVEESGYSHRRFIELFSREVGLTPKRYGRVLRFQRALRLLGEAPRAPLAALALEAGYSDQPHFAREFRELAGQSPGRYRELAPAARNHVPLVNSVQDAAATGVEDSRRSIRTRSRP